MSGLAKRPPQPVEATEDSPTPTPCMSTESDLMLLGVASPEEEVEKETEWLRKQLSLQQEEFEQRLQEMHEQHFRDLELALAEQRAIDMCQIDYDGNWQESDKDLGGSTWDMVNPNTTPVNSESIEVTQLRNDRELLQREVMDLSELLFNNRREHEDTKKALQLVTQKLEEASRLHSVPGSPALRSTRVSSSVVLEEEESE
eukprot:CAMPEP_0118946406 /NCGR_PEP_ID=MMETSP1169-20130426/44161_1 /TAXON_ID=36882 /ORGANISM="Pyramimonas obovata, Strain CCMP722" /LENGTH=200 /DNA_ID=CAMNT_0006892369 /DNA_START=224 /DNA_END=823 /DNA_ORIENTATION=+